MRLIDRQDTSLAAGLIAGTIVIFQQPLRFLLDYASDIQNRYRLDLIPALVVLSVVFVFHQYRKRQEMRAAARAAEAEARLERLRAQELEQLVGFGRSLANAIDYAALQQALWRHLPEFLRDARVWFVVKDRTEWKLLVEDTSGADRPSSELLESVARNAANREDDGDAGIGIDGFLCFRVRSGDVMLGVLMIREGGASLTASQRRSLGPALTFLGIATRNVQLIVETRETSIRDGLTQWFNRTHGEATLRAELQRSKRSGAPLSVLMFDLDHFKQLNDRFGHQTGDAALVAVTQQVDRMLRNTDIKCRYGGDEFLLILPDTPRAGADQVADNILRGIASLPAVAEGASVSVSIGVASARAGELDVDELVGRADGALYRAKGAGRSRMHNSEDSRASSGAGRVLTLRPASAFGD